MASSNHRVVAPESLVQSHAPSNHHVEWRLSVVGALVHERRGDEVEQVAAHERQHLVGRGP